MGKKNETQAKGELIEGEYRSANDLEENLYNFVIWSFTKIHQPEPALRVGKPKATTIDGPAGFSSVLWIF